MDYLSDIGNMTADVFEAWLDKKISEATAYESRLRTFAGKLKLLKTEKEDIEKLSELISENVDLIELFFVEKLRGSSSSGQESRPPRYGSSRPQ